MASALLTGLKRFILWDYARATWQYDVMVGLILVFLFLTPRAWFRDQQRIPGASRIAILQGAHGTNVYWIDAELLSSVPEDKRIDKVREMLRARGEARNIVRLEPALDSEAETKGYIAFARQ
ncbi:MAG: hypothetical protein ACM336_02135 [Acidobacteriota bacterium]